MPIRIIRHPETDIYAAGTTYAFICSKCLRRRAFTVKWAAEEFGKDHTLYYHKRKNRTPEEDVQLYQRFLKKYGAF